MANVAVIWGDLEAVGAADFHQRLIACFTMDGVCNLLAEFGRVLQRLAHSQVAVVHVHLLDVPKFYKFYKFY